MHRTSRTLRLNTLRSAAARVAGTIAAAAVAATLLPASGAAAAVTTTTPSSGLYVGVQLHALWSENTSADVDRQLDMLAELHSTVLRVDVSWSSLVRTGRGVVSDGYRTRLDYLAAGAARRGIKLLPNIIETPCWASSAPDTVKQGCEGAYWDRGVTKYPPADMADFAWVARYVAERYRTGLAALELWNEPNYNTGGYTTLNTADRPAVYTSMVKAAYPAVKAVAPEVPVLAGAMSFADVVFLNALYANGIKGHYDGISVHPYNEWRAPGAPHDPAWAKYDLVLGMNAVHEAMLAAGDASPVWITELGWTTCTVGTGRWCITEAQQADYLARAVPIVRAWPWVKSLVYYNLRNKGTDPVDSEHNFGLVRKDYTRKPAYASVAQAFGVVPAPVFGGAPTVTTTTPTTTTTAPTVTTTTTTTTTVEPMAPAPRRRVTFRSAYERFTRTSVAVRLISARRLTR